MSKIVVIANKDNVIYNFRAELMLSLKNCGYDVVFLCPYGKKLDFFLSKGFRNIDITVDRRGKNPFRDLQLIKSLTRILKTEKPDLVLTFTTKASIYGGYACSKAKIPYIVNNAGLIQTKGIFSALMNHLYKKGFKKSSCLMFQNDQEKLFFLNLLKGKNHFRRIPGSGVNLNAFPLTDYPSNCNKVIFNFVARIVKFKGIDEYLECASVIRKKYPNTEFRVFGDFDDDYYRQIVKNYQLQGIIEYKGVVIDMKPWIAECNAAIHPSYYEGMTNVVLEHSSMGRPCLGSNIPGVMDAIEDGKTGFVFEVKNSNSLITAVEKFLKLSTDDKRNMGINARKKMENEFSREIVTNTYLEEIKTILKK